MVLVIRRNPGIDDFERLEEDEYSRRMDAAAEQVPLPETSTPPPPEPTRGALYHFWPGDYHELRAEFAFRPGEQYQHMLVSNDGHVVTYGPMDCDAHADLLTIRAEDGSVVRTLRVRDVLTPNDQQWLCRGEASDVRFSSGETVSMTMLVTDTRWDDFQARHHTIDIDLATVRRYGSVETVSIVKPLPFGLDQAVRDAIMKWHFAPAASRSSGVISFRFEILRNMRPIVVQAIP